MLITLVLVIGVIFFFLRNVSATTIPSLALPFTILGTFAVMAALNFSLDNMSMMALILAIGFIVDDAIVMLENIVRHIEAGEEPYEAALKGSRGNRIHHRFDDRFAGGGVHPDSVHERNPGTPVPRIRDHHHGSDPDFRHRIDHADADAVQPLPVARTIRTSGTTSSIA